MPRIHVCSLQRLYDTVRETGARDVITVIKAVTPVPTPEDVHPDRHLQLNFSDIIAPRDGEVMASETDVSALLDFVTRWDRETPLLIHCYAGVSRSTASAFISACALRPDKAEEEWARTIRRFSPTATPNLHLVRMADALLDRKGRMVRAVEEIGRGEECFEGIPFALDIGPRAG